VERHPRPGPHRRVRPHTRTALEVVVAGNGRATNDELRAKIPVDLNGSTRGPLTRQIRKLQDRGHLPLGVGNPLHPFFDHTPATHGKPVGLQMDADLVPLFREALAHP